MALPVGINEPHSFLLVLIYDRTRLIQLLQSVLLFCEILVFKNNALKGDGICLAPFSPLTV